MALPSDLNDRCPARFRCLACSPRPRSLIRSSCSLHRDGWTHSIVTDGSEGESVSVYKRNGSVTTTTEHALRGDDRKMRRQRTAAAAESGRNIRGRCGSGTAHAWLTFEALGFTVSSDMCNVYSTAVFFQLPRQRLLCSCNIARPYFIIDIRKINTSTYFVFVLKISPTGSLPNY